MYLCMYVCIYVCACVLTYVLSCGMHLVARNLRGVDVTIDHQNKVNRWHLFTFLVLVTVKLVHGAPAVEMTKHLSVCVV